MIEAGAKLVPAVVTVAEPDDGGVSAGPAGGAAGGGVVVPGVASGVAAGPTVAPPPPHALSDPMTARMANLCAARLKFID